MREEITHRLVQKSWKSKKFQMSYDLFYSFWCLLGYFSKFSKKFRKKLKIRIEGSMRKKITHRSVQKLWKSKKLQPSYDLFNSFWCFLAYFSNISKKISKKLKNPYRRINAQKKYSSFGAKIMKIEEVSDELWSF